MSWTIEAVGTAEELRQIVHDHETARGGSMPESERLLAHHAIGHALGVADRHPGKRFLLAGHGHESPEASRIFVELAPYTEAEDG